MTLNRFIRDFKLDIVANSVQTTIQPPMRIAFDIYKSIFGGLNKANIKLYNMKPATRLAIVKDAEEFEKDIPITLTIGYQDRAEVAFIGSILRCNNKREGADITTNIEAYDGGAGVLSNYVNTSAETSDEAIDAVLAEMDGVSRGKISDRAELSRTKLLVGSVSKVLDSMMADGETWYIEDNQLYIIKDDEVTSSFVPVVSAETGLTSTPEREFSIVTFSQLIDPTVKIGRLARLISLTAPHLNGVYKIQDMEYVGDTYGDRWLQVCRGVLAPEAVAI